MTSKPLNVISIKRISKKSSKYELNFEGLQTLLEPIKDKRVVVIPIVGPSRMGKSFLLNYMCRYLTDPTNTEWLENNNQSLEGFVWKTEVDPQTFGFWLSQPFILKQPNDEEIAVLLMDTQGVFDHCLSRRDWATIVGLSLLVSSCLVFNLFNSLQEDILMTLESFLEYGLLAQESDESSSTTKPFQSLMFLIRDWNAPSVFNYGLEGGNEFLSHKLEIKDDQSQLAQTSRKLLNECFKDISCFLMPYIGDKSKQKQFNGCIDDLSIEFRDNLKQFITHLFSSENITLKRYGNNFITGEYLGLLFKNFVDVFNNTELPKPQEIIEANAKTKDLILINKLKIENFDEMKCFVESKAFISHKELEKISKHLENGIKNEFKNTKTSKNNEIIKELNELFELDLKSNYNIIYNENENRRIQTMNRCVDQLSSHFNDELKSLIESKFIAENVLDDVLLEHKHNIMAQFRDNFNDEDESLFDEYLSNMNKRIEDLMIVLRAKHSQLMADIQKKINETKEFYDIKMSDNFKDEEFFSQQKLDEFHEEYKKDAINRFNGRTDGSLVLFQELFSIELNQVIDDSFKKYQKRNTVNHKHFGNKVLVMINEMQESYESDMESFIQTAKNDIEIIEKHKDIKIEISKQFIEKILIADTDQFESYSKQLNKKLEESLKDMMDLFELRFKNEMIFFNEIRNYYKQEMEKSMKNMTFVTNKALKKSHKIVLKNTLFKFESIRDDMSDEKYYNFILGLVKDIYNRFLDENSLNAPTLPMAVGIDLGTTNSCVAVFKPGLSSKYGTPIQVIPNDRGKNTTPSYVSFRDEGEIVGDLAKSQSHFYVKNTVYSTKRLIGRKFNDKSVQNDRKHLYYDVVDDGLNNPKIKIKVNDKEETYFAEQISAKILRQMKEIAEKYLKHEVKRAVITVPAYFNDSQKEATKDAGILAGFDVMKIINEPTAAAIAYRLNETEDLLKRKVLIYDFGGGTFDVAVLVIERGSIDVMAVGGDNHLGGDDFDNKLIDYCLELFETKTGLSVSLTEHNGSVAISRLRNCCEEHKKILSEVNSTVIRIDNFYERQDLEILLSRDKFEELNWDLFEESLDLVAQTLTDAGLKHSEIDDIVLVGGSTHIPRIQELLREQFDYKILCHSVNPDEAVAKGAAIQAAILNGKQAQGLGHLLVSDVAPISLGIKVQGGKMSLIIPRNSKVPDKYMRVYTTSDDNQKCVEIEIYEGEEPMTEDNRLLGKFELFGIPSAPKREQKINVIFAISEEGILKVTASIVSTGSKQEIEIKEFKGRLTEQELEKIIKEDNYKPYVSSDDDSDNSCNESISQFKPKTKSVFKPKTPEFKPKTPEFKPKTPEFKPKTLEFKPNSPEFKPKTPEFKPNSPEFKPKTPEFKPNSPEVKPKTPEFKPKPPDVIPRKQPNINTMVKVIDSKSKAKDLNTSEESSPKLSPISGSEADSENCQKSSPGSSSKPPPGAFRYIPNVNITDDNKSKSVLDMIKRFENK